MRAVSTEQALDELYATALDAFVERRDALAKRLKDEGDAAAAATVKKAHKPTQIAYVLNQLARRHPDEVATLVDVGRELSRAQRKALRGGHATDELREAIAHQREVVGTLTRKTAALMQDLDIPPSGHLDEIAGALQAALVDPIVGAELEEGRLEKVPAPAAGFPTTAPLQLVRTEPPKRERRLDGREAARRARDARLDEERRQARARAAELAARAADAARAAKEIRADADRLAAEARARAKEADRAESAANEAQTAARHAARRGRSTRAS